MPDQFDVLVVGASFAGVACAVESARLGMRVALIDRKSDPGARLHTTGIIVKEATEDLRRIGEVPQALLRPITGVRLYAPNMRSITLDSPGYFFLGTDTPNLMRWLVDQARLAKVKVQLGTGFVAARRNADGFDVDGVGRCRCIVGADGPTSKVARAFSLGTNRKFLFGVEAEVEGIQLPEPGHLHCFIDRRLAPGYIGWAFEGVNVTQIGLAARRSTTLATPELDAFVARLSSVFDLSGMRVVARRAGLIPVGGPVRPLATAGVLLVGDAAGLVSPLTAGGIHTALESGRAAAVAVARVVRAAAGKPASPRIEVPGFRFKRVARVAFDWFQSDRITNLLMASGALSLLARLIYFHRRGLWSARAWAELLRAGESGPRDRKH